MKLSTTLALTTMVLLGLGLGCGNDLEPTEPNTPPAEEPTAEAPTEGAPEAPAEETAPPTEVDFEEQATEEITPDNLQEHVDRLALEIGEPPAD